MEWTAPETVSFGVVALAVITLLYRFIGQRSDPQLIGVLNTLAEANSKATDANTKSDERMETVINRLTDTLNKYSQEVQSMKDGNEIVFASILKMIETSESNQQTRQSQMLGAWGSFRDKVQSEHDQHTTALDAVLQIAPKIEELSTKYAETRKTSEGITEAMTLAAESQGKTNGEMLEALQRVQASQIRIEQVFTLLLESNRRNEKLMMELLEKPQQDLKVLEDDVKQTVETPVAKPEPKTEEDKPQ